MTMQTMAGTTFDHIISSELELREVIGQPGEMVVRKAVSTLDSHCRAFMAHSPFVLVATSSASGTCDVSPRGDAPGFAEILDDKTFLIPDRPGNRRADTLRNILENPRVGLLFLIPGMEETLRVNGRAQLIRDESLLARMTVQGKQPLLAIAVEVEEAFLHCAKAFKRASLWHPDRWPDRSGMPSAAQIWIDHARVENTTAEELTCDLEEAYQKTLY